MNEGRSPLQGTESEITNSCRETIEKKLGYYPEIVYSYGAFSIDQKGVEYATLHGWSQLYQIPHTSLLRALEGKDFMSFIGRDGSSRTTYDLYSEKDMVGVCVHLYHLAKLPKLDQRQICKIDGFEFITRQGFAQMHPNMTWPKVHRCAQDLEKKQGRKIAKYNPENGVPQFLPVYRLSALKSILGIGQSELSSLTELSGDRGERMGTIPLWAEYLHVSHEGLRLALKHVLPTCQVLVANGRTQNAYEESTVLDILQQISSEVEGNIVLDTLEDWLSLPEAGKANVKGIVVNDDEIHQSPDLLDTTSGWAFEFDTTAGAIEQLIKRKKLHTQSIMGRSGIRILRLYTRSFIAEILANKRPWGTKRKKRRKSTTAVQ